MDWKRNLDKEIEQHVNEMIRKTSFFPAYKIAKNPANAQLWVALGILARKVYEQELKISVLEGVLKEISPKKAEKFQPKEDRDKTLMEVERIMKEIAQRKPVTIKEQPKTSIVFPKLEKRTQKKGLKKKEFKAIREKIKSNF